MLYTSILAYTHANKKKASSFIENKYRHEHALIGPRLEKTCLWGVGQSEFQSATETS